MRDDIVIPCSLFFMIGWIVWVVFSSIRRYKVARFQAEVQTRLLHQLGTAENVLAYTSTPVGQKFVSDLTTERTTPYERILSSVQAGIIIAIFGVALLVLRSKLTFADEGFTIFGTLAVALGIGFGVAAIASYLLSRSFGLFDRQAGR